MHVLWNYSVYSPSFAISVRRDTNKTRAYVRHGTSKPAPQFQLESAQSPLGLSEWEIRGCIESGFAAMAKTLLANCKSPRLVDLYLSNTLIFSVNRCLQQAQVISLAATYPFRNFLGVLRPDVPLFPLTIPISIFVGYAQAYQSGRIVQSNYMLCEHTLNQSNIPQANFCC